VDEGASALTETFISSERILITSVLFAEGEWWVHYPPERIFIQVHKM